MDPTTKGKGKLGLDNFKRLIDRNPQIRKVELGGKGEVFLNENLPEMLRYAYERKVVTSIGAGTNLNDASDEALESLVMFQVDRVRCAIDGVTQETYQKYRVGGDLNKVIQNIHKINVLKERYRSSKPKLIYQFVLFGHNQHEMEKAALLAKMLKMDFFLKLNYSTEAFTLSVQQRESVRQSLGYADREDYLEKGGRSYLTEACYHLWYDPQIRWDGELLGCACNNFWPFPGNVFDEGLILCINGEKMSYAREMLMGRKPPREDIPCVQCDGYKSMVRFRSWITEADIQSVMDSHAGR